MSITMFITAVCVLFLMVVVYWDTGEQGRYRAGYDGKYDLLVFDSAPACKCK